MEPTMTRSVPMAVAATLLVTLRPGASAQHREDLRPEAAESVTDEEARGLVFRLGEGAPPDDRAVLVARPPPPPRPRPRPSDRSPRRRGRCGCCAAPPRAKCPSPPTFRSRSRSPWWR